MRHRFHAFMTQARGKFDHFCKVGMRRVRDVNAFAWRHNIGEAPDPLRLHGGSFDRIVLDELLYLYGQLIHFPARSAEGSTLQSRASAAFHAHPREMLRCWTRR